MSARPVSRSIAGVVAFGVLIAVIGACGGGGGGDGGGGTPTNKAPVAAFTATPSSGMAPLTVAFDAQASSDPDGTIASYVWDFGDGSAAASGVTATHDYPDVGAYTVTLTVTDNGGKSSKATHDVVAMTSLAAEWYSVIEIPSLGGSYTEPRRINNHGQVTGFSYLANSQTGHAFLYTDGVTRDLGTLGGYESWGNSLNNAGDVAGVAQNALSQELGFVYHAGAMKSLGTLGGLTSEAYGINDAGQIVGGSQTSTGRGLAFIYENGSMRSLGTLGGQTSQAADINAKGQITGVSATVTNESHMFIYQNGTMTDAGGGASGSWLLVSAMNDSLEVVGAWTPPPGNTGATGFLYRNGVLATLADGTTSDPVDINNAGIVVGTTNAGYPFVWDETQGVQDLNDLIDPSLGITLDVVQGINDVGQIVGHGTRINGGQNVAVLLTPTTKPVP